MADPNAQSQLPGQGRDQGQVGRQNQSRDTEGEIPVIPDAETKRMHRPGDEMGHTPNERGETPTGIIGTTTGGRVREDNADSIGSGTVGVPTGSGASGTNSSGETPSVTGNTTTAGGDVT